MAFFVTANAAGLSLQQMSGRSRSTAAASSVVGNGAIRQTHRRRLRAADRPSGQNQVRRALLPDQRRQRRARHRRIASKLDLRKSPLRRSAGVREVANHGQLRASTQAMPVHRGDRNLPAGNQGSNHGVELAQASLRLCRECGRPHPRPPKKPCPRRSARSRKYLSDFQSRLSLETAPPSSGHRSRSRADCAEQVVPQEGRFRA